MKTYEELRPSLKTGDLVSFGGYGLTSTVIKIATASNVSHVGVVLHTMTAGDFQIVTVIESTSLGDGFAGVKTVRMSTRISSYPGQIWVLPVDPALKFDRIEFVSFMLAQKGKHYDTPQAIMSAFDLLPDTKQDFSKMFCSELVAAGYVKAGLLPEDTNCSELTPADVIRMKIFSEAIQLRGLPLRLFR